ncbi:hypothetical protein QJQ45_010329 [Haematococcus lacustris]|nr:hypothetical protein QJQ45_010329 [Haematococcus lacustris]
MRGVCAAGLEAGAVVASEVVEARLVTQIEAWVEACSMRVCIIGITEHSRESKVWMAGIKPQQDELPRVTNYTASLQRYREYAATTLSTWPAMWGRAVQAALVQRQIPAVRRQTGHGGQVLG